MRRARITWSPVEITYLKKNRKAATGQLCIALAKSPGAIRAKLGELETDPYKLPLLGPTKNKRSRIGKRKDLGRFYRSSWESNFHRYIKYLEPATDLKYESVTYSFFEFGIRRGQVTYTPDFLLTYPDGTAMLVEIKGFFSPQDVTKLRRFKRFYPQEFAKLRAVVGSRGGKADLVCQSLGLPVLVYYKDIAKKYGDEVPNWEK